MRKADNFFHHPVGIVGIATRYELDGPGIESRWGGGENFRSRPDRPWGPPSPLYNGYRVFPEGKVRPGRGVDHPPRITSRYRVLTLYWGYLIVLWLFYLVCILYCDFLNLFWNVWVCMCGFYNVRFCVCVGFVMCRCSDNCVRVLVIYVLVFIVFLYCFFYECLFLFVTSVRITATEWKLNYSK